ALPPHPPNFRRIVQINAGPLREPGAVPAPLTPVELARALAAGAVAVDVRGDTRFDGAHVPGAISVSAERSGFGTRLAWVVDADAEVVLIGQGEEDGRRAARLAAAVGMVARAAFLAGGM